MGLTRLLDLTPDINATNPNVKIDVSGWDYVVVQAVLPGVTITVSATNDAGAIEGTTDGNAVSSLNYVAVQGTNLNTGAAATTITGSSITRFGVVGKFMQFSAIGAPVVVGKLLVFLFKIS